MREKGNLVERCHFHSGGNGMAVENFLSIADVAQALYGVCARYQESTNVGLLTAANIFKAIFEISVDNSRKYDTICICDIMSRMNGNCVSRGKATVSNAVSFLGRIGWILKSRGKIMINPSIGSKLSDVPKMKRGEVVSLLSSVTKSSLAENIENTRARSVKGVRARKESKASMPFIKNGAVNPVNALHFFFSKAEKSIGVDLTYELDAKTKSMMRRFLLDCIENDETETEIREKIVDIVENWKVVSGVEFVAHGIAKSGYPYSFKVTVPATPSFRFFYMYQNDMLNLLREEKVQALAQEDVCATAMYPKSRMDEIRSTTEDNLDRESRYREALDAAWRKYEEEHGAK